MGKLLRYVGFALLAVVLVIVIAAIVLPMVIDPNDYRGQIEQAVETRTGRQLTMAGDLELSVFPWLGVEIGDTTLANAPGFSDRPFARIDTVQVKVKLLPLLRKQLEMDTVVLKGLRVSLETDAAGSTNWAGLAGEGAPEPAEATPAAEPAEMALAGLAIGGVEITDAAVIWDDRQTPARYEIDQLALETGAIAPGETVSVRLSMQLASSEPEIKGPLQFRGTVALSDDATQVQLQDANLQVKLKGGGLPGGALDAELGFDSRVDLEKQTLDVTDLVLEALALTVTGGLSGENILGDAATFSGQLKLREFVPRDTIQALGQPLPEVSDPQVLGKADGELKLTATADSFSVPEFRLRLDDSALTGNLKVANFAAPAIRFNLHLDGIDVDRYLPPASDQLATPTTAAAAGAGMIPVDTLRTLNVDGKLTIDQLKAAQLRSTDIVMQLVAKDGLVRVHPASARMYEGGYQGDVTLDVRGKQPKIAMNERLSGVQVGPLLKDMTGEDRLTGATEASARLTASGQTPDELKKTLSGDLAFAFRQGAVKGVNLAALLRKAKAQLQGKSLPAATGPDQTDFSEITGTAKVINGVVENRDLIAKSPLLRVEGSGSVDLVRETLDYLVTAKVVGSLEGEGGRELDELKGLAIPVRLGGTFAEPDYAIRMDEALRGVAEQKVKEKVKEQEEKVKEKVQEKLEKKFGDSLKGLFQ